VGAERMRLDVMAKMRGVAAFDALWSRRTTIESESGPPIELFSLPDLIAAKKTQRDKYWPMIRRLVEAHYAVHRGEPTNERVRFWLAESRTPEMLVALGGQHPHLVREATSHRPLLSLAEHGGHDAFQNALYEEEAAQREADRQYWQPLRVELEQFRRDRK
jgi:hypothetical protein